jgi:hypothetical protein
MSDKNRRFNSTGMQSPDFDWLDEALHRMRPTAQQTESTSQTDFDEVSPVFCQRCREAGKQAFYLAKLRAEYLQTGFLPLPLLEFFRNLAQRAGVPLSTVLERFNLNLARGPETVSGRNWALLARTVGLSLRETLVQMQIWWASIASSLPGPLLASPAARFRNTRSAHNLVEECEAMLTTIEATYNDRDFHALLKVLAEVREVYETAP